MSTRQEFNVAAPDVRLPALLMLLSVVALVAGVAIAAQHDTRAWWVLATLPLLIAPILISLRRLCIVLDGDTLRIAAGMHSARVDIADLDLERAELTTLDSSHPLRPAWKTFGTSMPGYQAGHFRLRGRRRAFVLLTGRERVMILPQHSGRVLLLSPERPQALLGALRDVASRGARR
jgi:Bacterial PH domain